MEVNFGKRVLTAVWTFPYAVRPYLVARFVAGVPFRLFDDGEFHLSDPAPQHLQRRIGRVPVHALLRVTIMNRTMGDGGSRHSGHVTITPTATRAVTMIRHVQLLR